MTGTEAQELRVIITGAARGIGAATARYFAAAGAKLALLDLRDAEGTAAAAFNPERCRYWNCDVSMKAAVITVFGQAVHWLGGLDMLLNVAGLDRPGTAEDLQEEDWDLVMNVNAKGAMLTNKAAMEHMREHGGRILNFSSIYGVRGSADRAAYSAAKAAVTGWSRAAARDWGRFGITVNVIAPIMGTEVAQKYLDRLPEAARTQMIADLQRDIPLGGRLGDVAQDLAPLLLFLAGPGAAYITGQTFAVDGGMMIG